MKKYLSVITLATVLALSGCSSQNSSGADNDSSTALASDLTKTEIALVSETGEVPPEDTTKPPQIMVEYSGDGVSSAAMMTLMNYTWDGSIACGADPVSEAVSGNISADVDLDLVSANEPKIGLRAGSEITAANLYTLEDSDSIDLDFTQDGVIKFPEDVTGGVVSVSVKYEQGEAEYCFSVHRSQTDLSEPPALRIFQDGIGVAMTRGGYFWTVTEGNGATNVTVDCPSPWQMYTANSGIAQLYATPGSTLTIALPADSRITSAAYYTGEDDSHDLVYDGGNITMPADEISGVCSVAVEMPQGSCDYVFAFQTGTEFSTPAYDPGSAEQLTAE